MKQTIAVLVMTVVAACVFLRVVANQRDAALLEAGDARAKMAAAYAVSDDDNAQRLAALAALRRQTWSNTVVASDRDDWRDYAGKMDKWADWSMDHMTGELWELSDRRRPRKITTHVFLAETNPAATAETRVFTNATITISFPR